MSRKKYRVHGVATVTVEMGTYEAGSKEEAIEMALDEWPPGMCHQCAQHTELDGEPFDVVADEDG